MLRCAKPSSLTNPSDKRVLFKVKTTAPKSYCVRPNSGTIAPGQSQEVEVMLQSGSITEAERSKHKFMVQTMYAPSDDESFPDSLWKEVSKDKIMDTRLRCVFLEEQQSSAVPQEPSSEPSQPVPPSDEEIKMENPSEKLDPVVSPQQSHAGSTPSTAFKKDEVVAIREAASRTSESKLDKVQSENDQLKAELSKLRHRISTQPSTPATAVPVTVTTQQGSVMTPTVIIISIIAIILGYVIGHYF